MVVLHTDVAPRHGMVQTSGLRLSSLEFEGRGLPTLLLHGVTGTAWSWLDVGAGLRDCARPIAVDLRGHGDSQWSVRREYATSDHVRDVYAVALALGGGEMDVVGFSWGGLIGIVLAAQHPSLVRRLVVVDTPPSFEQAETDVPHGPAAFRSHSEIVEALRGIYRHADQRLLETLAMLETRPGDGGLLCRKHDPYFLERWPFRRDTLWKDLEALKQPTLVVRAERSHRLNLETAQRMVAALPKGRLALIPDSGHGVPVDNPRALTDAIRGALS
jgi:pimeloyl-ACP methyl ester carboxylesterase